MDRWPRQLPVCSCSGIQHPFLYNCLTCGFIACIACGTNACSYCGEYAEKGVDEKQRKKWTKKVKKQFGSVDDDVQTHLKKVEQKSDLIHSPMNMSFTLQPHPVCRLKYVSS